MVTIIEMHQPLGRSKSRPSAIAEEISREKPGAANHGRQAQTMEPAVSPLMARIRKLLRRLVRLQRTTSAAANCALLRAQFEGKEAIYVEAGVLRVRVEHIEVDLSKHWISARLLEIPSPGLGVGSSDLRFMAPAGKYRGRIGAGYLSIFSANTWAMGYGGWQLYFSPQLVAGVLNLAAQLEVEESSARHERINRWLLHHIWLEQPRRVFPAEGPRCARIASAVARTMACLVVCAAIYVTVRYS